MELPLLHIFRNTPFGRETLLQSACTADKLHLSVDIFIPEHKKLLFYFDQDIVQLDLDKSYLYDPGSARAHAQEIMAEFPAVAYRFIDVEGFTATDLPNLPVDYAIMTCPRSVSDVTSRIGLGHIGPKVRRLLQIGRFPVIIPGGAFKPWRSIVVLYGGSDCAANALELGEKLHKRSGFPLKVISIGDELQLRAALERHNLESIVDHADWQIFPGTSLQQYLYHIPHDALVVLGAYGHGPVKALLGSNMELVQSQLPNPLLVVGPLCGSDFPFR